MFVLDFGLYSTLLFCSNYVQGVWVVERLRKEQFRLGGTSIERQALRGRVRDLVIRDCLSVICALSCSRTPGSWGGGSALATLLLPASGFDFLDGRS